MTPDALGQIGRAYERMVREAEYRPGAPSDGYGNITGPVNLGQEQAKYAQRWLEEEDERTYWLGCPDYPLRPVMILTVEAARACAGADPELAQRLLELALDEARHISDG